MNWIPILSLLAGAMAWFIMKFLFDPISDIWELRAEMQRLPVLYRNLPKEAPAELHSEAGQGFRRVGAMLAARHISAWSLVRWICEHRRGLNLDIYSAGKASMGFGKAIIELNYSVPNIGSFVPVIRENLRLPAMGPTREFKRMTEQLGGTALPSGS